MRMIQIGVVTGFLTIMAIPQAYAETPEEVVRQIIKDIKTHPPATEGDDVVGEMLC